MLIRSITGGTSGASCLVTHSYGHWQEIVRFTAEVLTYYGLRKGRTILVAQPGFPWTIGSVFFEAARICEAGIIAGGLLVDNPILWKQGYLRPNDFLVISPSVLLKVSNNGIPPVKGLHLLIAGEPLEEKMEMEIRDIWEPCGVKRIYGSSEAGTIGFQPLERSDTYWLNPVYEYSLLDGEEQEGQGVLCIDYGGNKVCTNDIVQLFLLSDCGPYKKGMKFIKRKNKIFHLTDGSRISTDFILRLQEELRFEKLQCVINKKGTADNVEFLYVGDTPVTEKVFLEAIKRLNPDLNGILTGTNFFKITIRQVKATDLLISPRSKVPLIIEV